MRENQYQSNLIKELKILFPGCLVLKNDSEYLQGIPDLTLFYNDRWAMLEVKASETSAVQPNQEYYVQLANTMSFAAFIYPENERQVLDALQHAFQSRRTTRVPKRK